MKIEKVEELVANFNDKKEYVRNIRNLKQALIHGLVLKRVRRVIRFDKKSLVKTIIDMNADLRKKAKSESEKQIEA